MRHALSGGVSLRALDPDPPPFLSDPPAPLSAASSPTAITDAVHRTSALWLRRARRIDALTPRTRLRRGPCCVCSPSGAWRAPPDGSTPPRTPRAIPRIVLRVPPHSPALLPPFMPSGPWRASSPPSIMGVVHFTPSASARCRAAHILHAYAWLIHGAVGLPDVYGQDGRPSCTDLESIAIARVATASDAARREALLHAGSTRPPPARSLHRPTCFYSSPLISVASRRRRRRFPPLPVAAASRRFPPLPVAAASRRFPPLPRRFPPLPLPAASRRCRFPPLPAASRRCRFPPLPAAALPAASRASRRFPPRRFPPLPVAAASRRFPSLPASRRFPSLPLPRPLPRRCRFPPLSATASTTAPSSQLVHSSTAPCHRLSAAAASHRSRAATACQDYLEIPHTISQLFTMAPLAFLSCHPHSSPYLLLVLCFL
ncbi:hypothetical protein DFH09DRAFT_1355752 [Mycena vulgaris]|nr:hypothetical protein DFH09DRAFT_1355752 [Mycena vulgaris]